MFETPAACIQNTREGGGCGREGGGGPICSPIQKIRRTALRRIAEYFGWCLPTVDAGRLRRQHRWSCSITSAATARTCQNPSLHGSVLWLGLTFDRVHVCAWQPTGPLSWVKPKNIPTTTGPAPSKAPSFTPPPPPPPSRELGTNVPVAKVSGWMCSVVHGSGRHVVQSYMMVGCDVQAAESVTFGLMVGDDAESFYAEGGDVAGPSQPAPAPAVRTSPSCLPLHVRVGVLASTR